MRRTCRGCGGRHEREGVQRLPGRGRRNRARRVRASAVRSAMRFSTWSRAPLSTMIRRSSCMAASGSTRLPSSVAHSGRVRVGRQVDGQRDEQGPLALAQIVAGRLAGLDRVAEHAEHVVAQLERLTERHGVGDSAANTSSGAPAIAAPRCSGPSTVYLLVLNSATRSASVDRERAARLDEHVEVLAGHDELAHVVEHAAADCGRRGRTANSASAHDSSRSPSRIAAAAPKTSLSPVQPASRWRAAKAAWVDGRPRRVAEASITSSCTSAHACSSSRLAAAVISALSSSSAARTRSPAPVGEARTKALAAVEHERPRLRGEGLEFRADRGQRFGTVVEVVGTVSRRPARPTSPPLAHYAEQMSATVRDALSRAAPRSPSSSSHRRARRRTTSCGRRFVNSSHCSRRSCP